MLEELKKARAEYAAEVERLLARNLDEVVNARFELVREQIAQEVKAEFDDQLAKAQLNVEHYDFVIAKMEEKALAQLAEETETDIVENDNIENVEA